MLRIGSYELGIQVTDRFRLDGGAMFGTIPKVLWSREIEADISNRIQLVCRILVIRDGSKLILVDLGMGEKWNEKEQEMFAIEPAHEKPLAERIVGVTDIILTHLHFDHAAGVSRINQTGEATLTFPQAKHFLSKKNYLHAGKPGPRERASYLASDRGALERGKLSFTEDGNEIYPGIRAFFVDGHTHGLQWILIGEGKGAVAYPADLIPTAHHLPIPYVMGYDLCAETSMREKEVFLKRAMENEWIVVFEHDSKTAAATVNVDKKGRYCVGEVVDFPEFPIL